MADGWDGARSTAYDGPKRSTADVPGSSITEGSPISNRAGGASVLGVDGAGVQANDALSTRGSRAGNRGGGSVLGVAGVGVNPSTPGSAYDAASDG